MESLQNFSENLFGQIGQIIPGVAGALLVLLVGLLMAGGVRRLVLGLFKRTKFDERLGARMNSDIRVDTFVAKLAYYIIVIMVLMIVLNMMGISSVLDPLSNMVDDFLGFIPNIVAAGIIGFAGYIIATIASEAIGFGAHRLQAFATRSGLQSEIDLGKLLKQLVFIIVFFPILIAAIDTLNIAVISEPARDMFSNLLNSIPQLISAALILGVFYLGGRYVTSLLKGLLQGLQVDNLAQKMGVNQIVGSNYSMSSLISNLFFFFLMFTGVITAVNKLDMPELSNILTDILHLAGGIAFGIVILLIGNFLGNLAKNALAGSADNAWMGNFARFAILFIFLALGLSTMGVGQEIVNLAFGLTMGALAVAFALAFGLGGREAAGKYLDKWLNK